MSRPVYCDESVWVPVADGLSRRGWETHHAREEDTLGSTDREQLSYAGERDWILLTFDDDFLSLAEGRGSITKEFSKSTRPGRGSAPL